MPYKDPEVKRAKDRIYQKRWKARHPYGNNKASWRHRGVKDPEQAERLMQIKDSTPDAKCDVCGGAKRGKWVLDHDHETGAIRGGVHSSCNVALAQLGDTVAGLKRAVRYLEGRRDEASAWAS